MYSLITSKFASERQNFLNVLFVEKYSVYSAVQYKF